MSSSYMRMQPCDTNPPIVPGALVMMLRRGMPSSEGWKCSARDARSATDASAEESRLIGVSRIEAIFRAHVGDNRKILAASNQTDDG